MHAANLAQRSRSRPGLTQRPPDRKRKLIGQYSTRQMVQDDPARLARIERYRLRALFRMPLFA